MEDSRSSDQGPSSTDQGHPGEEPTAAAANIGAGPDGSRVVEVTAFGDLTEEDLRFLVLGAHSLRTGQTAEKILLRIASGKGNLLRIVGKAKGIIAGSILIHPGGKEFSMGLFAGEGIFPSQYRSVADSIFEWAKKAGCRWVKFENIHPSLDRYYARKFAREATVFVKEI
jgi:hypothetical protein